MAEHSVSYTQCDCGNVALQYSILCRILRVKKLEEIMHSKPYNGAYCCYYDVSKMLKKIKTVSNPVTISRE